MEGEKTKSPTKIYPLKIKNKNKWMGSFHSFPSINKWLPSFNVETKLIEQQDCNNLLHHKHWRKEIDALWALNPKTLPNALKDIPFDISMHYMYQVAINIPHNIAIGKPQASIVSSLQTLMSYPPPINILPKCICIVKPIEYDL